MQVTHRNVARLFDATALWFQFSSSDVWALFHSIAFDVSVWEMWSQWTYGGRLVVVPYLVSRTPTALLQLLRDEQVTVLTQTPSAFRPSPSDRRRRGSEGALGAALRRVLRRGALASLAMPLPLLVFVYFVQLRVFVLIIKCYKHN